MQFPTHLRENLIEYRHHKGLSQKQFIEHLDHVVTRETLSHFESGQRPVNNLRFTRAVADKMGIPVETLCDQPWGSFEVK